MFDHDKGQRMVSLVGQRKMRSPLLPSKPLGQLTMEHESRLAEFIGDHFARVPPHGVAQAQADGVAAVEGNAVERGRVGDNAVVFGEVEAELVSLISTGSVSAFRAVRQKTAIEGNVATLSAETADALKVKAGDVVIVHDLRAAAGGFSMTDRGAA